MISSLLSSCSIVWSCLIGIHCTYVCTWRWWLRALLPCWAYWVKWSAEQNEAGGKTLIFSWDSLCAANPRRRGAVCFSISTLVEHTHTFTETQTNARRWLVFVFIHVSLGEDRLRGIGSELGKSNSLTAVDMLRKITIQNIPTWCNWDWKDVYRFSNSEFLASLWGICPTNGGKYVKWPSLVSPNLVGGGLVRFGWFNGSCLHTLKTADR